MDNDSNLVTVASSCGRPLVHLPELQIHQVEKMSKILTRHLKGAAQAVNQETCPPHAHRYPMTN